MTEKLYTESVLLERTAAAMAARTEQIIEHEVIRGIGECRCGQKLDDYETGDVTWVEHIRSLPLASAPEQKWLEEHDAEIIMREHANHSEFASDLYCILIDPLAEGSMKEAELFAAVKKAAIDQRQALHDWPEKLTRQLAVARLDEAKWWNQAICAFRPAGMIQFDVFTQRIAKLEVDGREREVK